MHTEKKQPLFYIHGKNGFVTATKLGTTDKIFVAATKNFAAATKRFVDRTKHFVAVTKCFCYDFVSITKPFFSCSFIPAIGMKVTGEELI